MKVESPPITGAYATARTRALATGEPAVFAGAINAAMLRAIGIITIAVAALAIHMPMKPVTPINPASTIGTLEPKWRSNPSPSRSCTRHF